MSVTSTATLTKVDSAAADTALVSANPKRKGLSILNTDANALYVLLGSGTSSATNLNVVIAATTGYWVAPNNYIGAVRGCWAGDGSGSAFITEYVE